MKKLCQCLTYFVILINIVLQVEAVLLDECPLPEENYPCYCEEDDGPPVMHCNHLTQTQQLYQALSSLKNYKIYKINLYKNEMNPIKSDAFKGPTISQIFFMNSTISMESPQFVGQESSLKRLTFMSCFNKTHIMKSWDFSHLENLRDVNFDRNTIENLKNDWLSSSGPSLRSVTFSECGIKRMEDKAFQKVTELATLFLNDNEIASISRSMFPRPAENLRTISLNNNKLQDLPSNIFEDMPSLKSLELQKNLLKSLSESTWSSVIENLSRVYLDENPIVCDKSLKWISKTSLPNTFTGTCQLPAKLRNKNLRTLMPSDFH